MAVAFVSARIQARNCDTVLLFKTKKGTATRRYGQVQLPRQSTVHTDFCFLFSWRSELLFLFSLIIGVSADAFYPLLDGTLRGGWVDEEISSREGKEG